MNHRRATLAERNVDARNQRGETLAQRLARHSVSDPSGCVLWVGNRHRQGYGQVTWNGRLQYAHRLALELSGVDVPRHLDVLHSCDTPSCINPEHLAVGTHADNMRDMATKGRAQHRHGEANPAAKLDRQKVEMIRLMFEVEHATKTEIARRFGVSRGTIGFILSGETWRDAA